MKEDKNLRRIADYLLLYSSYLPYSGLFHGKIGIAVSLYMYSHKYGDRLTGEYAWDLFQQVYEEVHDAMPVGLEDGLAGIGFGTTLLKKHGLLEGKLNDTLYDVDTKIMMHDPRRMTDMSKRTGAKGLWLYIKLRESTGEPVETFDSSYMSELQRTLLAHHIEEPFGGIMDLIYAPPFGVCDYVEKPLGIDEGCAYYLIKDFLE